MGAVEVEEIAQCLLRSAPALRGAGFSAVADFIEADAQGPLSQK